MKFILYLREKLHLFTYNYAYPAKAWTETVAIQRSNRKEQQAHGHSTNRLKIVRAIYSRSNDYDRTQIRALSVSLYILHSYSSTWYILYVKARKPHLPQKIFKGAS